jgi:hypothetical protein
VASMSEEEYADLLEAIDRREAEAEQAEGGGV